MKNFVLPFSEINYEPSMAIFDDPNKGAQSQMQRQPKEPHYDGRTIDQVRDMSFLDKHDKLDQLGLATRALEENVKTYKKSGFHSQFTKLITQQKKR